MPAPDPAPAKPGPANPAAPLPATRDTAFRDTASRGRRAVAAATALLLALPVSAGAAPATGSTAPGPTVADCSDPAPRVTGFGTPATPEAGWAENLAFDGAGLLWVSRIAENRIEGLDPHGTVVATVAVDSPGGLARRPDGTMVAVSGVSPLAARAALVAFDPADPHPRATHVADLPSGPNGLAIDAAGNMYVTAEFAPTVTRIRPDGSRDTEWTSAAAVAGTNGIAVTGDVAIVTTTFTPESVVATIPLVDPAAATRNAVTRPPASPKALDDIAVTSEHIYATAFATGEIIRIDRATGGACVLLHGLTAPTSVRTAEGFGTYGERDLFITTAAGTIHHAALPR